MITVIYENHSDFKTKKKIKFPIKINIIYSKAECLFIPNKSGAKYDKISCYFYQNQTNQQT